MKSPPPLAITIAGSDCSAGAGAQADLKTFQHFAVHGLTVFTCIVAETADEVSAVRVLPVEWMIEQAQLLLENFHITAIKTGMLCSAEHVMAVAKLLDQSPQVKCVVDPVMVASCGARLLADDALSAYQNFLLPRALVITPNLPEAEVLLGEKISNIDALKLAALSLSNRYGTAVLLKGGHLEGDACVDCLAHDGTLQEWSAARIDVAASHGTGCTLSAAITAGLAHGQDLPAAIGAAKQYLGQCLIESYGFQQSSGQLGHYLNQGTTWARGIS